MTADNVLHAFKTPLGLPADKDTPPVCGAVLTDAYDFPGVDRPRCGACVEIVEAAR